MCRYIVDKVHAFMHFHGLNFKIKNENRLGFWLFPTRFLTPLGTLHRYGIAQEKRIFCGKKIFRGTITEVDVTTASVQDWVENLNRQWEEVTCDIWYFSLVSCLEFGVDEVFKLGVTGLKFMFLVNFVAHEGCIGSVIWSQQLERPKLEFVNVIFKPYVLNSRYLVWKD